jgi:isopropylmalate/homocitrate/citramalate synthase
MAAILANPSTYEIIDPALFGRMSLWLSPSSILRRLTMIVSRYISITSRITGWNAVKSRVVSAVMRTNTVEQNILTGQKIQLGYDISDDHIKTM